MKIIDSVILTEEDIRRVLEKIGEPESGPLTNGKPCRFWMAPPDAYGYGRLFIQGKTRKAHRLIFAIAKEEDPGSYEIIRHACHNRPCCEEAHLSGGTHADNKQDAVIAERHSRGEMVNTAKLTEEQTLEVIKLRGSIPQGEIARRFGISDSQVRRIHSGECWKHLRADRSSDANGAKFTTGARNGMSKLSEEDVKFIRTNKGKEEGKIKQGPLSKMFGISVNHVSQIQLGKIRKNG